MAIKAVQVTDPITITLLGDPVPWARAGGRGSQRFTPTKQRNNAATLRVAADRAMVEHGRWGDDIPAGPFDQAVRMDVHAEFAIPKSWSKKKQAAAIRGEVRHTKKPDFDNIGKQVCDALRGVVYRDDALIDDGRVRKRYGVQPKLVITVTPI